MALSMKERVKVRKTIRGMMVTELKASDTTPTRGRTARLVYPLVNSTKPRVWGTGMRSMILPPV